ncbi:uncharacterized protein LOC144440119 [Glandiceps talaboti]
MGLKLLTVLLASVLAAGCVAVNADLLVGMRYITTEVTTVYARESTIYTASTCGKHIGDSVNISMILNNNPLWVPDFGVVNFYVTDAESKNESKALCHNHGADKKAVPFCFVPNWKSANNLYVHATAGNVEAISFTMNVMFAPKKAGQKSEVMDILKPGYEPVRFPIKRNGGIIYLKQIAEVSTDQSLKYHDHVLLDVSFCPDAGTTPSYDITSIVFGTDPTSTFTQYICDNPGCNAGTPNIGFNGKQLPSNIVSINTEHQEYSTIYVYVVSWGGELNPATEVLTGHFRYSASITPRH